MGLNRGSFLNIDSLRARIPVAGFGDYADVQDSAQSYVYTRNGWQKGSPASEASKFTELIDSPDDYSGKAGQIVKVSARENGVEFGTDLDGKVPYIGATADVNLADKKILTPEIKTDGVAPADLKITTGADKTLHLQTAVWDDMRVVPGSFDRPGVSDPTITSVQPGGSGTATFLYRFEKNNLASFTIQLPHHYKLGTNIYCHIHWTPGARGVAENGALVGWKVDYTWADIHGVFGEMNTLDLSSACNGVDWRHEITPDIVIPGSGISGVSSMLICNVKRTDTGTDDTWAGTGTSSPFLLEIDFHYEIDTMGSRKIREK